MVEAGDTAAVELLARDGRLAARNAPGAIEVKRNADGALASWLLSAGRVRGIEFVKLR